MLRIGPLGAGLWRLPDPGEQRRIVWIASRVIERDGRVAGPNELEDGPKWYTCVRNGTQGEHYGNREGWYERVPR